MFTMSKTSLLFSILFVSSFSLFATGPDFGNEYPSFSIKESTITVVQDTIPPIQDRTEDFINSPNNNPFDLKDPAVIEKNVEYDVETGQYIITEKLGDDYFRAPTYMSFQEYMDYRAKEQEQKYFNNLAGVSTGDDNISGFIIANIIVKNFNLIIGVNDNTGPSRDARHRRACMTKIFIIIFNNHIVKDTHIASFFLN